MSRLIWFTYETTRRVNLVSSEAICNYLLQANLRSTPTSSTFFHVDLVMKIFLRPLIQEEQLSVNGKRMFTKYWLTASGESCPGTVVRITDSPNMTSAVYRGCKALNQTKTYEPHHEKTGFLQMQKQRRRSVSR